MRAVLCYLVILAASRSLHNKMLTAVLRAPVLFFDTNPVGEEFVAKFFHIVNRIKNPLNKSLQVIKELYLWKQLKL